MVVPLERKRWNERWPKLGSIRSAVLKVRLEDRLQHYLGGGLNHPLVSPLRILAAIAANGRMPPTARVAACKVLLGMRDEDPAEDSAAAGSDVAARAIQLMAAARKAH